MTVQFLGSGDAFGSGGRLQPCVRISTPTTQYLVDCGASSLVAMKRYGVAPADVDAILLTHLHGDHFAGVPWLLLEAAVISRRTNLLTVGGPTGLEDRIWTTLELLYPGATPLVQGLQLHFVELRERQPVPIGIAQVTAYPVVHPSGSAAYALRVSINGRVVAFSGDTEWTETLLEVADGADLFVCECSSFEQPVKYHLDYATLRRRRAELGCRRLVLTHMGDAMLQHLDRVDCEWADDGKIFEI